VIEDGLRKALLSDADVTLASFQPPYRATAIIDPHTAGDRPPLPLGTIVISRASVQYHAAALLAFACHKWPWVVPCLSWSAPDRWSPVLVPAIATSFLP